MKPATKKAGGKAAKYQGVIGRKDMSSADPDDLVIVDTAGHPLFQPARNTKPLEEWMVLSIMTYGVICPIKVVRGPMIKGRWTLEVVYGRQRVKAAREANKRLRAAGKAPVFVEIIIIHATHEQLRAMMEIENTQRTDYTPYELATTAAESLQRGESEEAVCNRSFKGSKTDMRRHLDLLRCVPEVQRAVIDGDLNFKSIDHLVKLTAADQNIEVEKLKAAGLSGPREVRARLVSDHPEVGADESDDEDQDGDNDSADDEDEEEEAGESKVKIRRSQVLRDRLAVLEGLPPLINKAEMSVRLARIAEIKWVLGDDNALVGVAAEELGPWGAQRAAAEEKAKVKEQKEAEKQAAKQQKEAEKQRKEAEKQAAKQQKEAEKQRKEQKEAQKAKQYEEDARQISLDAALPKGGARVPNKKGSRSKK